MQRPHILLIEVSKSTYLFHVSSEIKYAPYVVNMHYISCGGGGEPPQSASLHSSGNISMESSDQAQEQSRPLQHIVDSEPFVIFLPKILMLMVCILNIFNAD
jgi:hypothetical protein